MHLERAKKFTRHLGRGDRDRIDWQVGAKATCKVKSLSYMLLSLRDTS